MGDDKKALCLLSTIVELFCVPTVLLVFQVLVEVQQRIGLSLRRLAERTGLYPRSRATKDSAQAFDEDTPRY